MDDLERYDFWHRELDEFLESIKVYNHEIDLAINRVRSGDSISNDEVFADLDN